MCKIGDDGAVFRKVLVEEPATWEKIDRELGTMISIIRPFECSQCTTQEERQSPSFFHPSQLQLFSPKTSGPKPPNALSHVCGLLGRSLSYRDPNPGAINSHSKASLLSFVPLMDESLQHVRHENVDHEN